jgi:hypothetical protein
VDWSKQAEDMVKAWTDVQTSMWERTLKLAQPRTEGAPAETLERVSEGIAEAWRESVLRALHAQADWTRIWAERLADSAGMPPEVRESARRFQGVVEAWTDAQERLWKGWFETVQKASPQNLSPAWDELMSSWREATQRTLDAQSQWAQIWTGAAAKQVEQAEDTVRRATSTKPQKGEAKGSE